MNLHPSPLRYPGGKTSLASFLSEVIKANGLCSGIYVEPYAGGAGAALQLLFSGTVSKIYINDIDPRIYGFWRAVLADTDAFIRKIEKTEVTIREWKKQKTIFGDGKNHSQLEVGFATFYLNRCNRSGVLNGGPIGGMDQTGNYKIDARYNKASLIRKIETIGMFSERIVAKRMDGVAFLKWLFSTGGVSPASAFVYMDPPYFDKAASLYKIYFDDANHNALAKYLNQRKDFRWIISYDDTPFIRKLYRERLTVFLMQYSVHTTKCERELIISSPNCELPENLLGDNLGGKVQAVA